MNRAAHVEPSAGDFATARARMIADQIRARGIEDPATLEAMHLVPREAFVPPAQRGRAYEDGALSIGRGQTISQPYIVARMTAALGLADLGWPWAGQGPRLLDVGTGSGYQAAVLAQSGADVISIERDPELAAEARARLAGLGYAVEVVEGDGSLGLPERAPFAGIIVAAAAPAPPSPLVAQLAPGGRLVIPVGDRGAQVLTVVHRLADGIEQQALDPCVFVPLIGRHGLGG